MKKYTRHIILGLVLAGIVGAIFYFESKKTYRPLDAILDNEAATIEVKADLNFQASQEKAALYEPAKEISTPNGFINTNGITVSEFIGKKIILIDFWTYSCINCQRTLPYLNAWYEKYKDEGLVIIGLHTPEFEFEKDYNNVLRAVEKFEVKYPVVLDNDYSTWTSYRNRYWPRKYLIDIDGFIVYDHIGEGAYEQTEKKIVELLNERSQRLSLGSVSLNQAEPEKVDNVSFEKVLTPEIYLGSARLEYIANLPSLLCLEGICDYTSLQSVLLNTYQLDGSWSILAENAELISDTGSIAIRFSASKVNLVAGAAGNISAQIYLDGVLISDKLAGSDVSGGTVIFSDHALYNLFDSRGQYGEHLLEIRFLDNGINAFAFTFG